MARHSPPYHHHHWSTLGSREPLAACLYLLWTDRKTLLLAPYAPLSLLCCGIAGLLPYAYLVTAAWRPPKGSWGDTASLQGTSRWYKRSIATDNKTCG